MSKQNSFIIGHPILWKMHNKIILIVRIKLLSIIYIIIDKVQFNILISASDYNYFSSIQCVCVDFQLIAISVYKYFLDCQVEIIHQEKQQTICSLEKTLKIHKESADSKIKESKKQVEDFQLLTDQLLEQCNGITKDMTDTLDEMESRKVRFDKIH